MLALLATHFVGDHMETALSGVQTSMYLAVAPQELMTVTARYAASMVFYPNGSLIDGCVGFAFHRPGEGGFGYKISGPAGIFTALFVTLRYIGEECLILTDSLSSVMALSLRKILHRTHPLVDECNQMCSDLL
jgi:hypothetical protein